MALANGKQLVLNKQWRVHVRYCPLQKHNFAFDRVFSPGTSQEGVFDEISELVQSALDGHKVGRGSCYPRCYCIAARMHPGRRAYFLHSSLARSKQPRS